MVEVVIALGIFSFALVALIGLLPVDLPAEFGVINAGITDSTPIGDFNTKLGTFWAGHKLTGDNSLERPYAHLYPRLTTRSNTYTVHLRVQTLKKVPGTNAAQFVDGRDQVMGEYRGSVMIERFLDPNRDTFDINDATAVLGPYKFRVLNSKRFGG